MSANGVRLMLAVLYLIPLACFMACSQDEKPTLKVHSLAEAQTWTREVGKAPGMDVVVEVLDKETYVDKVLVVWDQPSDLVDNCANWYRSEDMWGVTWKATPTPGGLELVAPAKVWLSKGTWICHFSFLGAVVPQVEKVIVEEVK